MLPKFLSMSDSRRGVGWALVALFWPPMLLPLCFTVSRVSFLQCICISVYSTNQLLGQLAAVLLSLGVYTWVEHSLRDKLARMLDARIGARKEVEGRRKVRPLIVDNAFVYYSILFSIGREVHGSTWST